MQYVPSNSPRVQISRPEEVEHICSQCNCSCCPYVRARMEREAAVVYERPVVHYQEYVPMPMPMPMYYSPPSHPYDFYPQYPAPQMMYKSYIPSPTYSACNSRDSYSTADSFSTMSSAHMVPRALKTARSTGATTPVFR